MDADALRGEERSGSQDLDVGLLLQSPELAQAIGSACGALAARRASLASRACWQGLAELLPALARQAPPRLFVVGGHGGRGGQGPHEPIVDVARYDPAAGAAGEAGGCWSAAALPPCAEARLDAAAAVLDGFLYVLGGSSAGPEDLAVARADRLDLASGSWEALPPLLSPRRRCAAAALCGAICVAGGSAGMELLAAAERFDTSRRAWEHLPPAPVARDSPAGALVRGSSGATCADGLYLAGGCDEGYRVYADVMRLLVPHSDDGAVGDRWLRARWEMCPEMPTARTAAAAAAVGGGLYVIGGLADGWSPLSVVERYDLERGIWELGPPLEKPRRNLAAAVSLGDLYVLGGVSYGVRCTTTVEVLRRDATAWKDVSAMPAARCRFAVAAAWC
eukprot:TRINITY_DN20733_c0_g1_i1.p1 TRINITY_DN20733_c0_g1~~TRINITY_DN20733_c0_g1_i1.p1  ORF type:complete len:392 (+),score=80.94 TRINITY_DN20733_c0_g1_i1:113-1288(+)